MRQRRRVRGVRGRKPCKLDAEEWFECAEELIFAKKQIRGRQQRPVGVTAQQVIARLGVDPELPDRLGYRMVQAYLSRRREIVEQRGGFVKKQRQVVLDAGGQQALADILVDPASGRIALEGFTKAHAKRGAGGIVAGKLARGQQADVIDLVNAALGVDIESADAVDFVVEQVDAVGQCAAHRKQVDNAATDAEFTRRDNLRNMRIAGQHQLFAQGFRRQFGALLEEKRISGNEARGRQPVKRGGDRNHRNVESRVSDLIQRGKALGDQVLMR